jgi:quinol monooxygenase YgiN
MGSFAVKEGEVEALRGVYNGTAVPKVRACAGNLGCLLLEPAEPAGEFLVITMWRDRAAGEAYDQSGAAAEVVALVRQFFAGPPTLRSYESASADGLDS